MNRFFITFAVIILFIPIAPALCQTVQNTSFDGTASGWTNCAAGTPEVTYGIYNYSTNTGSCYCNVTQCATYVAGPPASGGCNFSNADCGSGAANIPCSGVDFVAEVDKGNSPGLCQTISSGMTAGNSYTLNIDLARRINTGAGGKGAPATSQAQVCIISNTGVSVCTTFVRSDVTWSMTSSQFNFTAPAGGGPYTIQVTNTSTYSAGSDDSDYGMIFGKICFNGSNCTTPITLLSFNAVKNGSEIDLKWQTAMEINNDYFTVEKSKNGIDFTTVGIIDGTGNSQSTLNYQAADHSPYNGVSYYRLKQTDFDGKVSYSRIEVVNFNDQATLSVYPNPGTGIFNIRGLNGKTEISVQNPLGQVVLVKNIFSDSSEIDLSSQPSGIYFLKVNDGDTSASIKIILQR
jgi:hypothetical protein